MKIAFWTDPTGHFSASKFWTQIAYAVATVAICVNIQDLSWELLLAYLAAVGGSEVAKKFLSMRYQSGDNSAS